MSKETEMSVAHCIPVSSEIDSAWYVTGAITGLPLFPGHIPPASNASDAWAYWEAVSRLSKAESKKRGYRLRRFRVKLESI